MLSTFTSDITQATRSRLSLLFQFQGLERRDIFITDTANFLTKSVLSYYLYVIVEVIMTLYITATIVLF